MQASSSWPRLISGVLLLTSVLGSPSGLAAPAGWGQSTPEKIGFVRTGGFLSALSRPPNEACASAHVTQLFFEAIPQFNPSMNYCDLALKTLPPDVLALLEKIAELNWKVAKLLDQKPDETFSMGIGIRFSAAPLGGRASEAQGGLIALSSLPEWTFEDFSSKIYVHELMHILIYNPGPTAAALRGLEDHPFLVEALPDLISATVHESPKMEVAEKVLPACLRVVRDETPIRSMDEPFRQFYIQAEATDVLKCCATLHLDQISPFAKSICIQYQSNTPNDLAAVQTFVKNNEIEATPYDEAHLSAEFAPAACRTVTKTGLVYFDGCDNHQFAYPLVSFFFRFQALTGRSLFSDFFAKLGETASGTAAYRCGFTRGTEALGGAKTALFLRPLLGAFSALRESLGSAERAAFDRAWKEHDFGKVVDLDRQFTEEALPGLAQIAVKAKNTLYSSKKSCTEVYQLDPVACQVSCEKMP